MSSTNYRYEMFPDRRFARVEMWDSVDGPTVLVAMTSVYADERWKADFDVVWDLRQASELIFEWDDFKEFIELDEVLSDLVGAGRDLLLVSSQMHEAIAQSYAMLAQKTARKALVCRTDAEVERALEARRGG